MVAVSKRIGPGRGRNGRTDLEYFIENVLLHKRVVHSD